MPIPIPTHPRCYGATRDRLRASLPASSVGRIYEPGLLVPHPMDATDH